MKKILSVICSLMLCFSVGGYVATSQQAYASESTPTLVSELFVPSGISIEPLSYDQEMLFMESGLKLISSNVKEKVTFKSNFAGEFSMEYLPEKVSGVFNVNKFTLTFTDVESGDSFALNLEHGSSINTYVTVGGENAGIYYSSGSLRGLTTLTNDKGTYTQITAEKIKVRFDPDTMSVYAGAVGGSETLVWDLTKEEIDGKSISTTLNPFAMYSVSLAVTELSSISDKGSVVVYKVNGCALDSLVIKNSGTPSLFADFELNALVGEAYTLPTALVYDVVDGLLNGADVAVVGPDGQSVSVTANAFTPTAAGEYTVTYTTENSQGVTAENAYTLIAYESAPTFDYEMNWNLSKSYSLGQKVVVPEITLFGGLLRHGEMSGKVTVKNGSETVQEDLLSGNEFTFSAAGEYTFIYDIGGDEIVEYTVTVTDEKVKFVTDGLDNHYDKGTFIDATAFTVTDDGVSVDFNFSVEYPDGKKYSNKKFILSDIGVYTIRATYVDGSDVYEFEKTVTVNSNVADFFAYTADGASVGHGKSPFTGRSGAIVHTSASGQMFNFTQPIDISKHANVSSQASATSAHKIKSDAVPLIELSIDPYAYTVSAATGINVYLTDAANPDNVLRVYVENKSSAVWSYIRAAAPNQSLVGYYTNGSSSLEYDNSVGRLDYSYGMMFYHSVKGQLTGNYSASDSKISIYYDNATKQVLTHNYNTAETDIVVDLDDTQFVSIPWSGFESDTVYLSFALAGVSSTGADAVIYSVDGIQMGQRDVEYDSDPVISLVDSSATIAGIKDKTFKIPQVTAFDCYGGNIEEIVTKVYYQSGNRLLDVSVSNGKFTTDKVGTYYVVYSATDMFGNVGELTVPVTVTENYSALAVVINQDNVTKAGLVASEIPLLPAKEASVENGIGTLKVVRKVYLVDGANKTEVEVSGDILYTTEVGTYSVEYSVIDGTGREASSTYEIAVTAPEEPVLVSALPAFVGFVRGNSYQIPDVYYIDYQSADPVRTAAEIYVDGQLLTGNEYSIARGDYEAADAEEAAQTVTIEYKCGDHEFATYSVPVKTVYKYAKRTQGGIEFNEKRFVHERFFISEGGAAVSAMVNNMVLSSTKNDGKISFVQPLASRELNFVLDVNYDKKFERDEEGAIIRNATNIKSFSITLTDALDMNKVLVLVVSTDELSGNVIMSVNGELSQSFTGSLLGIANELISIGYNNKTMKIVDVNSGAEILTPKTYLNGKTFVGFSDTVYASFSFELFEEDKTADLRLYSINGQGFAGLATEDTGAPFVTVNGSINGVFDVGEKITVPTATASDVFGSISLGEKFHVTVTYENGGQVSFVKDVNGLTLDKVSPSVAYEFVLSAAGTYRIDYYAEDSNGRSFTASYIITAVYKTEPVITVKGSVPATATVGKSVSIPSYTVEFAEGSVDNLTYVVAISPSFDIEVINENEFTPEMTGTYTIRYIAFDQFGNVTMLEFDMVVSK